MSAILSVDELNDFISPGVACIKPVETLPSSLPPQRDFKYEYEVTTEEQLASTGKGQALPTAQEAQISLTDCLACSGCVTSAEAVLISLQSHEEVMNTLDSHPEICWQDAANHEGAGKVFVASVSPQTRANIAATYQVTESQAGHMIDHLLRGPHGLKKGGLHNSGFTWVLDTNTIRDLCIEAGTQEVLHSYQSQDLAVERNTFSEKPVLASSCPGWICYAEKTHPHVLPYLSRLKSPQAMAGTLIKSVLSQKFGVTPSKVWHVAIMPCFDKKLEASRQELTDVWWRSSSEESEGVRDVDCVITARELIMLAESRGISIPHLPRTPVELAQPEFPDKILDRHLFSRGKRHPSGQFPGQGTSGGYAYYILQAFQKRHPGSEIRISQGRNLDVVEYILARGSEVLMKTARYYGFRNIQNLVRALKPTKASRLPGSRPKSKTGRPGSISEYAFIEVMACPGGCTNGGGQIKASDLPSLRGLGQAAGPAEQKQWLAQVDEAYFSADGSENSDVDDSDKSSTRNYRDQHATVPAITMQHNAQQILQHWSDVAQIPVENLARTKYKAVESNIGKAIEHVATSGGGGW